METKQPENTAAGIQIFPHHLQIPGNAKVGTQNLTIREQVMGRYAEFVKHWNIAVSQAAQNPTLTFAQLWINDSTFRGEMSEGLQCLGVPEPENILPSHLQELLLVCMVDGSSDVRPAIFRLHSDAPDPKTLESKTTSQNLDSKPLMPLNILGRLLSKTPKLETSTQPDR